jgi:hypothetical protein
VFFKNHCIAVALACLVPPAQARPDFSGTWVFDEPSSTQRLPGGRVLVAKLLGDEVTIAQSAKELTLAIRIGTVGVDAVYALDGSESQNLSSEGGGAPDVTVTSRAAWEYNALVIRSTSTSEVQGRPVVTETIRRMWIDAAGRLILDRSGTPASDVPTSRSVYTRAK